MADFSGIFVPPPTGAVQTGTVTTGASSAEIDISVSLNGRIAIAVTGNANVRFGNSGVAAATASDLPLWGGSTSIFNLGQQYSAVRVFNNTASTITYWIWPMFT